MATGTAESLLLEVRDLLSVIADALEPQYRETVLRRLGERAEQLRSLVGSASQWEALALMDGSRTQAEIAGALGMDQGYLSRYVKRMRDAGFVKPGTDNPESTLTEREVKAVAAGVD